MNPEYHPLRQRSRLQQSIHLNARQRRFPTLVGFVGLGSLKGLIQRVGGEDPEDDWYPGRELHLLNPSGTLTGHEVVVPGIASHYRPETENEVDFSSLGE
jgi:hypothetical protein